jgi:hypothetical protein
MHHIDTFNSRSIQNITIMIDIALKAQRKRAAGQSYIQLTSLARLDAFN